MTEDDKPMRLLRKMQAHIERFGFVQHQGWRKDLVNQTDDSFFPGEWRHPDISRWRIILWIYYRTPKMSINTPQGMEATEVLCLLTDKLAAEILKTKTLSELKILAESHLAIQAALNKE